MKSYQTQHEKEGYLFIYFFKELKEKFEWVDNFKVWCIVKKKFKKKGKKKKKKTTPQNTFACFAWETKLKVYTVKTVSTELTVPPLKLSFNLSQSHSHSYKLN